MKFEDADHRYQEIRRQWDAGQLSLQEYTEAINELRVQTADGVWWQIRGMDGAWLRWNGAVWEETTPPNQPMEAAPAPRRPAPIPPPGRPGYQTLSPQPGPSPAATPSNRTLLWVTLGCTGCVLLLLVAGIGAAIVGILPIPGAGFTTAQTPDITQVAQEGDHPATAPPTSPASTATAHPAPTTPPEVGPTTEDPIPDLTDSSRAQAILARGTVQIAVHDKGFPPLSIWEGGVFRGFEADLAQTLVSRLFGETVVIEWVPVAVQDRFALIQAGSVDILLRSITHTTSREEFGYFTGNYFLDGLRLLVRSDSQYFRLADLAGKRIAIEGGTSLELELAAQMDASGVEIEVLPVATVEDAYGLLVNGDVDAVAGYWTVLLSLVQGDPAYWVTGPLISVDPYGMMVPLDDPQWRDHLDAALEGLILDSSWYFIFPQWFEGEVPFSEKQLFETPPIER